MVKSVHNFRLSMFISGTGRLKELTVRINMFLKHIKKNVAATALPWMLVLIFLSGRTRRWGTRSSKNDWGQLNYSVSFIKITYLQRWPCFSRNLEPSSCVISVRPCRLTTPFIATSRSSRAACDSMLARVFNSFNFCSFSVLCASKRATRLVNVCSQDYHLIYGRKI